MKPIGPCILYAASFAAAFLAACGKTATAQNDESPSPESQPALPIELKTPPDDHVRLHRVLSDVRDHVYSFDHPAFYLLRERVRSDPDTAQYNIRDKEEPVPWRFLMERPRDYRGQLVLIEGILLSKSSYVVPNRRDREPYYECHLASDDTRAVCTVVAVEDPSAIPIKARVRAKCFFVLVRAFQDKTGKPGAGPLLVGKRLEQLEQPPPSLTLGANGLGRLEWLVGGTALLAITWLVLRRVFSTARVNASADSFPNRRGEDSKHDFDWLLKQGNSDAPGES